MKLFFAYLRLIRPFNLVMIVFTLYMVRLFFLLSAPGYDTVHLQVGKVTYALFSLSFVLLAAAGYIINDYYDIEIDKVNKPERTIIGNTLSPNSALTAYWLLNSVGIITGFLSCYHAGITVLGILFLFYLVGLWLYSYKLKSTFFFGNILIGIFLALVPLGGACIELLSHAPAGVYNPDEKILIWELLGGISIFAFLSTFIREIVKDMEDIEGDTIAGCRTMPIVIGIRKTKWITFFLILLLNAALGWIQYQIKYFGFYPLLFYLVFIQIPFMLILYMLLKATTNKDFHKISTWLKVLMLTGIMYVFAAAHEVYSIYLFFNSFFK
jgi:4-hydroxybenzoate polyprenyltransferase